MAAGLVLGLGGMYLWDLLSPPQVVWSTDWASAEARAQETGRPVLALFPSPDRFEDEVLSGRAVLDALNFRVIPLRLGPSETAALAERLEVTGERPAWRLLNVEGREFSRRDGMLEAGALEEWLKEPLPVLPVEPERGEIEEAPPPG